MERATLRCSFCNKGQSEVQRLIAGPRGVYICNQCVALCNEILAHEGTGLTPGAAAPPSDHGPVLKAEISPA